MGNSCAMLRGAPEGWENISRNPSGESHPNDVESRQGACRSMSPSRTLALNLSFARSEFSREQLERATNGFSDSNFLGKGSFGNVHKGILEDGRQVAIKQLIIGSPQGDREFQAEVEIISRVHHRHLVALVGWCISEGERMVVYEFLPNNTLNFHLHGHPNIIHRDIKSDNILLDNNYEAKIADFGLARIFPDDQTHVEVTKIAGTFGYLDPEYATTGELTDKSDAYSFGVILLELVTGMRPNFKAIDSTRSTKLVNWARRFLENHDYEALVDPRLQKNYNADELARVVECAAACVRPSSQSRPQMIQVVRVLEGHSSIESLIEDLTSRRRMSYNSNRHLPVNTIQRSSTLNPDMLEGGAGEHGASSFYYSINSNGDQANINTNVPAKNGQP